MFSWTNITDETQDVENIFPDEISILPLRGTVGLPFIIMPLVIVLERSVMLVEDAIANDEYIGLAVSKVPEVENPTPDQIYHTGVIAKIHRRLRSKDGSMQIIVQGLERFTVSEWTQTDPYFKAKIAITPDEIGDAETADVELEALTRRITELARQIVRFMPQVPDEAISYLEETEDPRALFYTISANMRMDFSDRLKLLTEPNLLEKMRFLLRIMTRELEILELSEKIQAEAKGELDQLQREYFLRQQMKAIRKELGEADETEVDVESYKKKFEEIGLPEEAKKEAIRELNRLQKLPPQAAEYGVIKTYLDWLTDLPWNKLTEDNLDIEHARDVLNADHYGLEKIKDRILEYLAVRKLRRERHITEDDLPEQDRAGGSILLFVGPPGVGKTSLGRSIARALNRKFTRMSLGGVRDEAEIRGHRRTYIGAMPGRIIQALKRAESRNPVFMLDEVDKIGNDWRGDPSSALLEVLDPQQNHAFRDHYLDVDFDLSEVMFIVTANTLETIPAPLRDRMEIIPLDGYTEFEKVEIAKGYLVPRQIKSNGLQPEEIIFTDEGLHKIVQDYTREAGVRTLEREIGKIARKVATKVATRAISTENPVTIEPETVREYLGKPRFHFEAAMRTAKAGVATGLAVTSVGGDVLFVEASRMAGGSERLTLTGQLGDVMKESAQIALSYVRAHCDELGIAPEKFSKHDIHLHVPAGAIPKDGPSAGVTMVTALVSLLTGRPVKAEVGMTGEISLQGQVLPIGGLKQKALAAHRAGLKTVIFPKRNDADVEDVPEDIRKEMTFIMAETIDDVLAHALTSSKPTTS